MKIYKLVVPLVILGLMLTSLALAGNQKGIEKQKARTQEILKEPAPPQLGMRSTPTVLPKGVRKISAVPNMPTPSAVIEPLSISAALSGKYEIGSGGDFTTLYSAVAALNSLGVGGAVVMELIDATYNSGPVTLGPIAGASATNTITFRPDTGVAVTVYFQGTETAGKGFNFMGAQFVTIDGISPGGGASLEFAWSPTAIFPVDDPEGATIFMGSYGTDVTSDITIQNMTVNGIADATNWNDVGDTRFGIYVLGWDDYVYNVVIDNCTFGWAFYPILVEFADVVEITNNLIGTGAGAGPAAGGICAYGATHALIADNQIIGIQYNSDNFSYNYTGYWPWPYYPYMFGICDQAADASTVVKNNTLSDYKFANFTLDDAVYAVVYGMRLTGNGTAYNNTVSNLYADGDESTIYAIRFQGSKWYHNSVYLNTPTYATSGGYMGIPVGGTATVYNNIFYSTVPQFAYHYGTNSGSYMYAASDYNSIDAPGYSIAADRATGIETHSVQGNPYFLDPVALTIDNTKYSAAENVGKSGLPVTKDKPGTARDTSAAGKRDAGAYEFTTPNPLFEDVVAAAIPAPDPNGAIQGFVSPVSAQIVNARPYAATVDLNVKINDGVTDVYDKNVTGITLPAFKDSVIAFPTWIPVTGVVHTVTATITADDETPNNVVSRSQAVVPTIPYGTGYYTNFDNPANPDAWVGTADFVHSNTFTKLGGPYGGSGYSWVTEDPNAPASYSTNTISALLSPFFDMSGVTGDVYVSFRQSIWIEPTWDRSLFQYSADSGKTWVTAGVLNDPDGINWYDQKVYQWAAGDTTNECYVDGGCIDNPIFLPHIGGLKAVNPAWASNGDPYGADVPTGPEGYVFVALKLKPASGIQGSHMVRFRYLTWSDFGSFEGWAIDEFSLGSSLPAFAGTINGNVFFDQNGNGTNDGGLEVPEANVEMRLAYFGVPIDTTFTDVNGIYSFGNLLPGTYTVTGIKANSGFSVPLISSYTFDHDGLVTITKDFGTYVGTISGFKFEDVNNSGSYDAGDVKLSGYTINVNKDSLAGPLITSIVTDTSISNLGNYTIYLGPGTFVITETVKANEEATLPVGGKYTVTVSGNSGTFVSANNNFGNFKMATLTLEVSTDKNGNGVREASDYVALGTIDLNFDLYKNGSKVSTVTLGTAGSLNIYRLGAGNYYFKRTSAVPTGWIQTIHTDSVAFPINISQFKDTVNFLYFKCVTVSGSKFDDTNGNGVKDAGEPGLPGWIITVSGEGGGADTTDATGAYLFPTVGRNLHNVTETTQTGWNATTGPFSFTAESGNLSSQNNKGFDFGNFKTFCVSGVKFRDRNGNGVKDVGEDALAGWTINLTGQTPFVTGVDGSFEFCGLGVGSYTLTEVAQPGWMLTLPAGGQYDIVGVSGVDVTGLNFGNFSENDTTMYRTFTYEQLAADLKKNKTPKVGKPILGPPNMANLLEQLMLEGAVPKVGLAAVTDPSSGKIKAYLQPKKYGDITKTFNTKGTLHTGTPKGFDVDNKGKLMLKLQKSMPPTKFNNMLTAQLLTLQVNLWASQLGHTPVGLGSLLFIGPGILNGLTIDEIADYGDEIMTNWAYVPKANYDALFDGVKAINEVFANTVVNDTVLGWFPLLPAKPYSKSTWAAYKTVYEVPFLKANPGVAPRIRPVVEPLDLPLVYELGDNYPNPFNPTTTISFSLPVDAFVTLRVYNLLGQEVATLIDHEAFFSGEEEVDFDASQLASGVYLYRIVAESINDDEAATGEVFTQVKKMILMK